MYFNIKKDQIKYEWSGDTNDMHIIISKLLEGIKCFGIIIILLKEYNWWRV